MKSLVQHILVPLRKYNKMRLENMELQMKVSESFIILSQVGAFSNAEIKKIRKRLDKKGFYLSEGK